MIMDDNNRDNKRGQIITKIKIYKDNMQMIIAKGMLNLIIMSIFYLNKYLKS